MSQAGRDQNFVPTLLAVSSTNGTTPIPVYADPTTHRLLVDNATPGGISIGDPVGDSSTNGVLFVDGSNDLAQDNFFTFSGNNSGTGTLQVGSGSGFVGVGTSPTYNVDVLGDINFTGDLRQNGTPVTFGGTPGSPDTSIQFNDSGSFGGDADFTWDKTLNNLTIGSLATNGSIQAPNGTTNQDGAGLQILSGTGNGAGDGGFFFFSAGAGGASGAGGSLELDGGGSPIGNGGAIDLYGGVANDNTSQGGNITLHGGAGTGDGSGGDIILKPGDYPGGSGRRGQIVLATDDGSWDQIELVVQDMVTVNTDGDGLVIQAGKGNGTGDGGFFQAIAGEGGVTGDGGDTNFSGGNGGATSGNGGNITFNGGNAVNGDSDGGSITFRPGFKIGAGSNGTTRFQDPSSNIFAVFDTTSLASSDKTFTFPNQSGTFALVSDLTAYANTALSNLASVAINTSLLLGTSDGGALGSTTKQWSDLFLAEGGVINWDNGDATITQVGNMVTLAGADLTVPNLLASNLTSGRVTFATTNGQLTDDADMTFSGSRLTVTDLTVTNTITGSVSGNAGTVTVADAAGDTTTFVMLAGSATGTLPVLTDASLTFNATTNALTTTTFIGALTGNASTATALQNARTIGGVSFDGTANVVPQTIQSVNEATDTTCFPLFISASGTQSLQPLNNTTLTFNSNTGALGATSFVGSGTSLTGIPYTITGTANQVIASAGTGNITLSLPQSIATASTPQFARLGLGVAASGSADMVLLMQSSTVELTKMVIENTATSGALTGVTFQFKTYNGSASAVQGGFLVTSNSWSYGTYLANQVGLNGIGTGGLGFRTNTAPIAFYQGDSDADASAEAARFSSTNFKIGGTASRGTTEGTKHLDIFDGTAPVGTLANGISLYSEGGECKVMDAAGNATQLSPHNEDGEWIYYCKNTVTGRTLKVDMERLVKDMDKFLGGGYVHESEPL